MNPDLEERLERIDTPKQTKNENDTLWIRNIDEGCSEDTYDSVRISERYRDPESGRILTTFKDVSYHFNHGDGFQVRWSGQTFTIKPGETMRMPRFLAEHFAYHLVNHMLDKKGPNARTNANLRPAELAKIIVKEEPFFAAISDSIGTATLKQVEQLNRPDAPMTEVQGLNYSHGAQKGIELKEDTQTAKEPLYQIADEEVEPTESIIDRVGTDQPEDNSNIPDQWKSYTRKELIQQIRNMDPGYKFPQNPNKTMLVTILQKIAGV